MSTSGFQVKRRSGGDMALQITAMADIFIIILVFLLKSFASGAVNITPSAGVKIPAANITEAPIQVLLVEVSADAVQVDNKAVVSLKDYHFLAGELAASGISTSLDQAFDLQRKKQGLISESNSEVSQDNKLVLVADQRVPYVTIKAVLASAAIHGFSDFKLAVIKEERM
jgi:biopolymer transport protein ExbD